MESGLPSFRNDVAEVWEEPCGDRRIELVIIGRHLDETLITDALNECLLTDEELEAGPAVWDAFDDPFDPWLVDECQLPDVEGNS
jgi:hypothetical protein